ncbi:unnamed protein product [Vitrella brassicaformis CCMP3155]|uniref:Sushi domain-containing protein n=3 Tax=Vitrella brassicaformis TaxID=1169539 RepID=A0A0G4EKN0_VITBC|nr:unnamed protein product [Vitrella brassicaformis CCMP3155]|eukprot:CEL97095.1 unnamed protein product [Vitrella brassicaformis CCMP3155]
MTFTCYDGNWTIPSIAKTNLMPLNCKRVCSADARVALNMTEDRGYELLDKETYSPDETVYHASQRRIKCMKTHSADLQRMSGDAEEYTRPWIGEEVDNLELNWNKIDPVDIVACDDGHWTGRQLRCFRRCAEFPMAAARGYVLRPHIPQHVGVAAGLLEPTLPHGITRRVSCDPERPRGGKMKGHRMGYWAVENDGVELDKLTQEKFSIVTCRDGTWTTATITCQKVCPPITEALRDLCIAYRHNLGALNKQDICYPYTEFSAVRSARENKTASKFTEPPEAFKAKSPDVRKEANETVRKEVDAKSKEGKQLEAMVNEELENEKKGLTLLQMDMEESALFGPRPDLDKCAKATCEDMFGALSPYQVIQSIFQEDIATTNVLRMKAMAMPEKDKHLMARKPGDVHLVVCDWASRLAPMLDESFNFLFYDTLHQSLVGQMHCRDGRWTELPIRCSMGCRASFDMYASAMLRRTLFGPQPRSAKCDSRGLFTATGSSSSFIQEDEEIAAVTEIDFPDTNVCANPAQEFNRLGNPNCLHHFNPSVAAHAFVQRESDAVLTDESYEDGLRRLVGIHPIIVWPSFIDAEGRQVALARQVDQEVALWHSSVKSHRHKHTSGLDADARLEHDPSADAGGPSSPTPLPPLLSALALLSQSVFPLHASDETDETATTSLSRLFDNGTDRPLGVVFVAETVGRDGKETLELMDYPQQETNRTEAVRPVRIGSERQ